MLKLFKLHPIPEPTLSRLAKIIFCSKMNKKSRSTTLTRWTHLFALTKMKIITKSLKPYLVKHNMMFTFSMKIQKLYPHSIPSNKKLSLIKNSLKLSRIYSFPNLPLNYLYSLHMKNSLTFSKIKSIWFKLREETLEIKLTLSKLISHLNLSNIFNLNPLENFFTESMANASKHLNSFQKAKSI